MKPELWRADGTRNGHAVVSADDVVKIRAKWDEGLTPEQKSTLADLYGCSLDTIRKIGLRKTFKDVPEQAQEKLDADTVTDAAKASLNRFMVLRESDE